MGKKERPICVVPNCDNPALVLMFNRYFCGECVAKWHKKQEEQSVERMFEDLK